MRIRVLSVVFSLCLAAASSAQAQFSVPDPAPGEQFAVELGAMLWTPTPEIRLSTGNLDAIGIGRVDFVEEFGIEDKRFTEFRATLRPGRKHKLRFSYVPIAYDEQAQLTRTITFGSLTVPVSANATADLQWDLYRFGYEWDFVARDRGFFGVITEVKYSKVSADLVAEGFGSELTEAQAPIPTIGVVGRAYPHRLFSITGEFTGFKVPESFEAFQGKFYDFDLYGTLSFGRFVGVQGGYRSVVVDYASDDDAGELRMKGMYFGGVIRF